MQNCYFYVDYSEAKSQKDGKIYALCSDCGKSQKNAWFWDKGYGKFDVTCKKCDKKIYEHCDSNPNPQ